jgi:orotate phosphoribosyltransferase
MPPTRQDIERLRDETQRLCVQFGDFTLSSGAKGKYYYNGKRVTLRPSSAKVIGEAFAALAVAAGAEAVGGPALGAVPIATAVALASLDLGRALPVFTVRMEQKAHGARDLIAEPYDEGGGDLLVPGRRLAVVEDAITTGGSVRKAIEAVETLGCQVALIAVLVERHEGGADTLRAGGYDVVSIFRTDEAGNLSINEEFLRRLERAQAKT